MFMALGFGFGREREAKEKDKRVRALCAPRGHTPGCIWGGVIKRRGDQGAVAWVWSRSSVGLVTRLDVWILLLLVLLLSSLKLSDTTIYES